MPVYFSTGSQTGGKYFNVAQTTSPDILEQNDAFDLCFKAQILLQIL